jgi:O-antigen ligase
LTRFHQATTASSGRDTFQIRLDTIKKNWGFIEQSPIIGHGLDQTTLANYYYPYLRVFYPAHNLFVLLWFGGGIFFLVGALVMMGSSFHRLLRGRLRHRSRKDPLRDIVLAGCVTILVYSMQGPELVDRWLWLPFILALCFRSPDSDSNSNSIIEGSATLAT